MYLRSSGVNSSLEVFLHVARVVMISGYLLHIAWFDTSGGVYVIDSGGGGGGGGYGDGDKYVL